MNYFHKILKRQYQSAMREAYAFARSAAALSDGNVLDCGCASGHELQATFGPSVANPGFHYSGLEWSQEAVRRGKSAGLDIRHGDLNKPLPFDADSQDCVIAFSVVEHLLMPCSFLGECHRVLKPGGRLVVLTPNISTYFTAAQILLGRMPSSGPHPDSNLMLESGHPPKVTELERATADITSDTPEHRHLVVFSFKALHGFLTAIGFEVTAARGFGYYPLPLWLQPLLERMDRNHCHQMVLVCDKPG